MEKKQYQNMRKNIVSLRLLFSYLVIILAPVIAIVIIYCTMQNALLNIQKEKIQNLSNEARVVFNKEVQQVENIGKYISGDERLKDYMSGYETSNLENRYYETYKLAKSYPDYTILNRFVKYVYIMPEKNEYIIQIPEVISGDARGISLLDIGHKEENYEQLYKNLSEKSLKGKIFCEKKADGTPVFMVIRQFYTGRQHGLIIMELENKEIQSLLKRILGTDEGAVFLVDDSGEILLMEEHTHRKQDTSKVENWKEYLDVREWKERQLTICENQTDYLLSILTVIPDRELLSKAGNTRTVILILCVFSIFAGIAICLWYWNSSHLVVENYLNYKEKYSESNDEKNSLRSIWKSFGKIIEHTENLQMVIDGQKQWAREGIIRKLLHGNYNSKESLEEELKSAEISFPVQLPCYLVGVEMDDLINQEDQYSLEKIEKRFREILDNKLPYYYEVLSMKDRQFIVMLSPMEKKIDQKGLKMLFEEINYELYSKIPIEMYTAISGIAEDALEISEEYDHVCRILDYAKYYKMRVPLFLEDLPQKPYVVFTVEMEMQLEQMIRNGTKEQIEKLLDTVVENYLQVSGKGRNFWSNMEIVRYILLRCLEGIESGKERAMYFEQIQGIRTVQEMTQMVLQIWEYFSERRSHQEEETWKESKQQIEKIIQARYQEPEFNLAAMAEDVNMSEKKLYREFKKMFQVSFASYLEVVRIHHAQNLLMEGRQIQEIAGAVGYSSDYSFRRAFKRVVGVTPSDYQKIH